MNPTLTRELLAEHRNASRALKHYKERERVLRDKIVSLLFPNPKTGTNKASLKELGLEVKAVIKDNWTVTQTGLSDFLSEHDGMQRAFKYKHELVMAGYKTLSDKEKQLLAQFVSCKPGAPELKVEGELPKSYLNHIKVIDGCICYEGNFLDAPNAYNCAKEYGFESTDEFVKFLEEIA
jgi:hypothetical protein